MLQKTSHKNKQTHEASWHLVDLDNQVLGRAATRIAQVLMGKHTPTYSPQFDSGDSVVVINAEKVVLTGKKEASQEYVHYTGYPGGRRVVPVTKIREEHPDRIIRQAVKRMLPKTKLGRQMLKKLHVYVGPEHQHAAQKPQPMEIGR